MPNSGYFDVVFAQSGDLNTIPDASQPSGTVSYTQGFPVGYSTPVASGGILVPRTAINQALYDITSAVQNYQQNCIPPFITTAMNNGSPFSYAAGAMVFHSGVAYMSLVGSNTDTPPSSKWVAINFYNRLTSNTSYYVSTTGNDSNPGTSGSPWLTLQHAIDYIANQVDLSGYTATINVADGTYTGGVTINAPFPPGIVYLKGNTTTPANCIISITNTDCIGLNNGASLQVGGFTLETTTGGDCITVSGSALNITDPMVFGACANTHMAVRTGGAIYLGANYTVTGGAINHYYASQNGVVAGNGITAVTVTGTPSITFFANAFLNGTINAPGITYSGSVTGTRYLASVNGAINTNTGGANYFPGSLAGSTSSGGQYQ